MNGMIVIPAFREAARIGAVIQAARTHIPDIVVVDDGSPDATAAVAAAAGAAVLRHARNLGKGAALRTGFRYAREKGADYVLTLDADGQHATGDIPRFMEAYATGRFPVLVGNRMHDPASMPRIRRWTNRFMSFLLSRRTGQWIPDSQNGFRLYRTDCIPDLPEDTSGFAAESEILLELARRGIPIGAVPVQVIYGAEQSKIRPFRDTLRFIRMWRSFHRRAAVNTKDESHY